LEAFAVDQGGYFDRGDELVLLPLDGQAVAARAHLGGGAAPGGRQRR
jgi:hypothetical protein